MEITDRHLTAPIHINAANIAAVIAPQGGSNVLDVMQRNVNGVLESGRGGIWSMGCGVQERVRQQQFALQPVPLLLHRQDLTAARDVIACLLSRPGFGVEQGQLGAGHEFLGERAAIEGGV